MRVLFVDDDIFSSADLREGLLFAGYDVDFVSSADEAFLKIDEGNYDVLITDLMMPNGKHLSSIETRAGFITGIFIARASQHIYPEKEVFIYTGHKKVVGLSSTDLIVSQSNLEATIIKKYFTVEVSLDIIRSKLIGKKPSGTIQRRLYDTLKLEPNFLGFGIDIKKLLSILKRDE